MIRLLALLTLLGSSHAQSQEITLDHIKQAICQVETGTVWIAPGKIKGRWQQGEAGEIGPWQMLPAVLMERGFDPDLVRSSARLAEQAFIAHFRYLTARTPSIHEAVAAYHRGLGGRSRLAAKAYAGRVVNLAHRLAQEAAR